MFFNNRHVPDDVKVSYLTTPIVYLVRSKHQCERELQGQTVNSMCLFYTNSFMKSESVKELFSELQKEKVIRIKRIPEDLIVQSESSVC